VIGFVIVLMVLRVATLTFVIFLPLIIGRKSGALRLVPER